MSSDSFLHYFVGAVALALLAAFIRAYRKFGGFTGMIFGARIRNTFGEVEGARLFLMTTVMKVHTLDGAPDKAIGLEFVTKTFASYRMTPFAMSIPEARKLIAHLQSAIDAH